MGGGIPASQALAKIMTDNADEIDRVIEELGPSVVAEFFIQTGAMIASAYNLNADDVVKNIGQ